MEKPIDIKDVEISDPPELIFIPVRKAIELLWEGNPKLHDIGSTVKSIERHGFQELPKFDINLNRLDGSLGAIKAGNGRIEALNWMERQKRKLPRGLGKEKGTGIWVMPLLIGTDADGARAAKAYAIDSNNLTVVSGDSTILTTLQIYDPRRYAGILNELQASSDLPVTIDRQTMSLLIDKMREGNSPHPYIYTGSTVKLPTSLLTPNDYDPHAMTDNEYAVLLYSIKSFGILVPILVRPIQDGKFEIVDGMQRFKAAKELQKETVPVRVKEMSRAAAIQACIATNGIGGRFVASRMKEALQSVTSDDDGYDTLNSAAGFNKKRVDTYKFAENEDAAGNPGLPRRSEGSSAETTEGDRVIVTITMEPEQYAKIEATLLGISLDWSTALLTLCRERRYGG